MFYNIFGSFLVLQLWLYIQYFVLENCLLGDNFLCIYSCQVSVADLVLYSRFWNCAAWSRVFILVEKLQLRLMMLLLNYFLKLRCFGKCFLISFKNCPPTFVFTRSLYGALNHITFLFLLFHSLCCSDFAISSFYCFLYSLSTSELAHSFEKFHWLRLY